MAAPLRDSRRRDLVRVASAFGHADVAIDGGGGKPRVEQRDARRGDLRIGACTRERVHDRDDIREATRGQDAIVTSRHAASETFMTRPAVRLMLLIVFLAAIGATVVPLLDVGTRRTSHASRGTDVRRGGARGDSHRARSARRAAGLRRVGTRGRLLVRPHDRHPNRSQGTDCCAEIPRRRRRPPSRHSRMRWGCCRISSRWTDARGSRCAPERCCRPPTSSSPTAWT